MVRVVGGWPAEIWGPWCRGAVGTVCGRIDFAVEVMVGCGWECYIVAEVVPADSEGCGCVVEVQDWR
jgi:hypothetical protein